MKKRILACILSILTLIILSGCKKEDLPADKREGEEKKAEVSVGENSPDTICLSLGESTKFEHSDDSYSIISCVHLPAVFVYSEDENKYGALKTALEKSCNEKRERLLDFLNTNREYAAQSYEDRGDSFASFEAMDTPYVRRADALVTSILFAGYTYEGGIHGNYYYGGENYDTESGKLLTLSDVVADKKELAKAIYRELEKFRSHIEFDGSMSVEEILENEDSVLWSLEPYGITIYFPPYTIANYASGTQVVTLQNDEYPAILKDEYKKAPKSYGVQVASDLPFYYDVTGDGKADEIIFSSATNDYMGDALLSIYINGEAYTEENWFYDADATFIHTEDGKNYLYVEVVSDNDYRLTLCYSLSDKVRKIDEVYGGMYSAVHEYEDFLVTREALINPRDFKFEIRTNHLSTISGSKNYKIGKNGLPETDEKAFLFDEEAALTFTLLRDVKAVAYDMETEKEGEKVILKYGEKVLYIATDNEKYAYFKCEDGKTVRIETKRDEEYYMHAINGVHIDKIFNGIIFAG